MEDLDSRIKLRHLKVFLAVAEQKGLMRASKFLGTTQPAVTKTVQELEEIVGATLFERSRKGAEMTEVGQVFHAHANISIGTLSRAVISAKNAKNFDKRISIGIFPNVASLLIPEIVHEFQAKCPEAITKIVIAPIQPLLKQLQTSELDVVLGRMSSEKFLRGLHFEFLYTEPLVFVVDKNNSLAKRKKVRIDELLTQTIIVPPQNSVPRVEIDRFFFSNGVSELPKIIETNCADFARDYIKMYEGAWIVPLGTVKKDINNSILKEISNFRFGNEGVVGITTQAELPLSNMVLNFIDIVRKTVNSKKLN